MYNYGSQQQSALQQFTYAQQSALQQLFHQPSAVQQLLTEQITAQQVNTPQPSYISYPQQQQQQQAQAPQQAPAARTPVDTAFQGTDFWSPRPVPSTLAAMEYSAPSIQHLVSNPYVHSAAQAPAAQHTPYVQPPYVQQAYQAPVHQQQPQQHAAYPATQAVSAPVGKAPAPAPVAAAPVAPEQSRQAAVSAALAHLQGRAAATPPPQAPCERSPSTGPPSVGELAVEAALAHLQAMKSSPASTKPQLPQVLQGSNAETGKKSEGEEEQSPQKAAINAALAHLQGKVGATPPQQAAVGAALAHVQGMRMGHKHRFPLR